MSIRDRVNMLINKHTDGNKKQFARIIGISPSVIENIVGTRDGKPSYDVMCKICTTCNVTADWLLLGIDNDNPPKLDKCEGHEVAVIPSDILHARNINIADLVSNGHVEKQCMLNLLDPCDCVFRLDNNEMSPTLHVGDLLFCSYITHEWVLDRRIYVLNTAQYGTIVRIIQIAGDKYRLIPINNDYSVIEVDITDVVNIARLVYSMRSTFAVPDNSISIRESVTTLTSTTLINAKTIDKLTDEIIKHRK